MTPSLPGALEERLVTAQRIVAFTGAGMSAESGVPTFRGPDGIWSRFRPEELASMDAFLKNPARVWEWYTHRRRIIAGVQPNPGHLALAQLEQWIPSVVIVTQNIDNLHRRAGSSEVYELHGNIERNYCRECGAVYEGDNVPLREGVPRCTTCGGLIRPDVVWFGEMLPEDQWDAALRAAGSADLLLSIGTSGLVYPAAMIPSVGKRAGAFLVEVNTEPTPFSDTADLSIRGSAGDILPLLVVCARRFRPRRVARGGRAP
jgi:NAD-dependent deacetylase